MAFTHTCQGREFWVRVQTLPTAVSCGGKQKEEEHMAAAHGSPTVTIIPPCTAWTVQCTVRASKSGASCFARESYLQTLELWPVILHCLCPYNHRQLGCDDITYRSQGVLAVPRIMLQRDQRIVPGLAAVCEQPVACMCKAGSTSGRVAHGICW